MSILAICLSPGLQRTVSLSHLIPGEVNRANDVLIDVAGKGVNVCRVLTRLGLPAICLGQGGDNAEELLSLTRAEGLDLRLIPTTGRLRTCTTVIETAHDTGRRITELVEPTSPVADGCTDALTSAVNGLLPDAPALVIAGSMAPGFPADYQAQLAALARAQGVPVFVDLQGAPLRACIAAQPAVVKINLSEFVATFLPGQFSGGEQSGMLAERILSPILVDAIAEISRQQATRFVLTRGAQSVLIACDGHIREIAVTPLPADQVMNPIGSGDSFLAGFLARLMLSTPRNQWNALSLDTLEAASYDAIRCAQSNARTLRPGFLEPSFPLLSA